MKRFKRMHKSNKWVWLGLTAVLMLIGCRTEDATWARIQETGVLRVGLDPSYPPFEVAVEDGAVVGIDVDLMRSIGDELGVAVEFVWFGYDGLYDALQTEQVDVLASALVILPDKQRDFAYSDPYFNAGERLVVRQTAVFPDMAALNGHTVAVELGSQGHVEATSWERRLPELTILPLETPDAALTAVLDNRADAALVDAISSYLFVANQPELILAPEPVTVEPFALVVRIDDSTLLTHLNSSLETLRQSGQLQAILNKWMAP